MHKYRIGPFAAVDIALTLLLETAIFVVFKNYIKLTVLSAIGIFVALVFIAEAVHSALGIPSQLLKWMQGDFTSVCDTS